MAEANECQLFCALVPTDSFTRVTARSPHVHLERDDETAKLWLDPVRLQSSGGFGRRELNQIQRLVDESREQLLRSWNEFFSE